MNGDNQKIQVTDEFVIQKIYLIRNKKVMLDRDLAELYGVETKYLKRQVRRNIKRFPNDFMFEMTKEELKNWRSQFGTSNSYNSEIMGLRYVPFCFTEQGVAMLSSVLNSEKAIEMNIRIIRVFTHMREMIMSNKDILLKLEKLETKVGKQDEKINLIFQYIEKMLVPDDQKKRKRIGYL